MFDLTATSDGARAGILRTAHGDVATPVFMPVGTKATVKGVTVNQLQEVNVAMLLANCYHLMVTPSVKTIADLGGLHEFMNWHHPILTDSGGFQLWSLARLRKLHEDGVTFRSHRDGALMQLSPASVVQAQHQLGSNITMVLDECPAWESSKKEIEQSLHRTHQWAWRSLEAFQPRQGYGIFAITQGGAYDDLRLQSAHVLTENDLFDGYALGGLSVGEDKKDMLTMVALVAEQLPTHKPRYLMGVGRPLDILQAVARGVDMFDCVLPTRCGRNGKVFTWRGEMTLRRSSHQTDAAPVDAQCSCPVCHHYSRAYLHHLLRNNEMLAASLLSLHNIAFYQQFMTAMRQSIIDGNFKQFHNEMTSALQPS